MAVIPETVILDGKVTARKVRAEVRAAVATLAATGTLVKLGVIQVGADPASTVYVRNKHRACKRVGMASLARPLSASASTEEVIAEVEALNQDPSVHGILVQLPLPAPCDTDRVLAAIDPQKDVDGLHPYNQGLLAAGAARLVPCTPRGVIRLLDEYSVTIDGANAVVLGRSRLVGLPLARLLTGRDATVTVCHSHSRHLKALCQRADIVVAAIGKPEFVRGDFIAEGAAVVDVGINRLPDGALCGDVCFSEVAPRAGFISPVPGGVGPMTIAMLLANTVSAAKEQCA